MIESFVNSLLGILIYQALGVALLLPLELAFPKVRLTWADRANGFLFLIASAPIAAAFGTLVRAIPAPKLLHFHHGFWSPVLASIVLALWVDFQFYISHRMEHRFFWRFHAVHHSIRNLSAANSYHHWSDPLWVALSVGIPLMFVDVAIGPTLGLLSALFRFQQFFIHSSSNVHLGPLRWALVDNRYHRIHHSTDPAHRDKNFGAMTPLWDWLFGTAHFPKKGEWPEVGLDGVNEPRSLLEWSSLPLHIGSGRGSEARPGGVKANVGDFNPPDVGLDVPARRRKRVGSDV